MERADGRVRSLFDRKCDTCIESVSARIRSKIVVKGVVLLVEDDDVLNGRLVRSDIRKFPLTAAPDVMGISPQLFPTQTTLRLLWYSPCAILLHHFHAQSSEL